jgi:mandelate racemase
MTGDRRAPRLRGISSVGVVVPLRRPLGTSAQTLREVPLLLVDLETEEGITGHAYLFCYFPKAMPAIQSVLAEIAAVLKGEEVAPLVLEAKLRRRFTLIGVQGIVRMAVAAVDTAAWDAFAKSAGLPLATLLGAAPKPVLAYNSCGLGIMAPEAAADEAETLLEGGFRAVKLRLGRPTLEADLAATRAVRRRLPDDVRLMVDFNQGLTPVEALRRGHALDGEGVYWIEEPIRHDDYENCAKLADAIATPVQIGENFNGIAEMEKALRAGAADYVMPDLERIVGVTGWLRAGGLAAGAGVEMSSHLFPEVSAHLLAATPTAHYLEYMDWAEPVLAEPIAIEDGHAVIPSRLGNGMAWNRDAVARYRVDG